jgi:hypothetical protein
MIFKLAMSPVMAIVAAAIMAMTIAAAVVDAEYAVHTSDDSAHTGSDGAADDAADRSGRAIAAVGTLVCPAFHASENTLRMRRDRQCKDRQSRCDKRKAAMCRGEGEQGRSLHRERSP